MENLLTIKKKRKKLNNWEKLKKYNENLKAYIFSKFLLLFLVNSWLCFCLVALIGLIINFVFGKIESIRGEIIINLFRLFL